MTQQREWTRRSERSNRRIHETVFLPVHSEHELDQASARIERVADVLIGARQDVAAARGAQVRVEVDGVEQVQRVNLDVEAASAGEGEPLFGAQFKAGEQRG